LEVVAKTIYLLNFYSGLSIFPVTVWNISGLRSRRQNDTAQLRSSSLHKHGSGYSSGALGFHECGSGSGALFYHGSGFCSLSHINILILLVCLKLNGKWI